MTKSSELCSLLIAALFGTGSICVNNGTALGQNNPPGSPTECRMDGLLDDLLWERAETLELVPLLEGVPQKMGGTIHVALRGSWLCLGAFLPEPGGKVTARSIGYNPVWERFALTSPPVEDRVQFQLYDLSVLSRPSVLEITVNPWGAIRIERDGIPVPETGGLRAVDITSEGWCVELSIPIQEVTQFGTKSPVQLSAERVRSRRALSPEYHWETGELNFTLGGPMEPAISNEPVYDLPVWGNRDPALEVGRVQKVPSLDIPWDDPFWQKIPGFELPRNEPYPRAADYPTRVKWVHDGATLQVFFENSEDGRLDVNVDSRDGNVSSDDHVALYLALSGSASVEILANPVGAIRDAKSSGPRAFDASSGAFDAGITGSFVKEKDRWMVRLNLPLGEIAAALGGKGIPDEWKVLIGRVRQERPGEPAEISTIPTVESSFLNAPARFRALRLTEVPPAEIGLAVMPGDTDMMSAELQSLSPYALSRVQRRYYDVTNMLSNQIDRWTRTLAMQEHEEWDEVESLQDWEAFRNKRMPVLRRALGDFPGQKCQLDYQVTSTYRGDGYQVFNIVYQSRPGFYVAANLYLPENPPEKMPGMIILPAHHYPKTHGEMKDCGMVWARTGVAVLIMEHIGYGERLETSPLYRQAYESEYLLSQQLELVGQSLQGWIVYDVIRTVDLFEVLGTIDMDRIILIGSVTWGGGRRAAPAGLLEERIDAQIIYNFGRVYWYGWGTRNLINNKITPWFVVNAFAPRKLVYAHEFWYEGEEGPGYPEVWVPAWPRYQKVYALYGKEDNLATAQGEGLLRAGATEFIPRGDCYMLGTVQRRSLYPLLERWFDIPYPSEVDQNIPLDSGLTDARQRPDYPVIKYKESLRRPTDNDVLSIPPSTSERLGRKALHQIASERGKELLAEARTKRSSMKSEQKRRILREQLGQVLGDIDPDPHMKVVSQRNELVAGAEVEALTLEFGSGIIVPLFLMKPRSCNKDSLPVVLALAEGGKARFLKNRSSQLNWLLRQGFAVCMPDVRGTGETAFSQYNRGDEAALSLAELGESLLGSRLKDVRTVLEYLKSRPDIDAENILLWGDSFVPANAEPIWVDELLGRPVSPQIQHVASPLGAHLALLTAFYDSAIRAVAVRGSLISYMSLLESNITYVPPDIVVSRLLEVADIVDIAASLSPTPLFLSAPVTGRNFLSSESEIAQTLQPVKEAYGPTAELILAPGTEDPERALERIVGWLAQRGSLVDNRSLSVTR